MKIPKSKKKNVLKVINLLPQTINFLNHEK